jgi:hypothetical protein
VDVVRRPAFEVDYDVILGINHPDISMLFWIQLDEGETVFF